MKAATFAWFVNGARNASEQAIFKITASMQIKGFHLALSAGALDWSIWDGSSYAVFDFQALISDKQGWPDNLSAVASLVSDSQVGGTNTPPGFDPPLQSKVTDGALVSGYAIVEEASEHANENVVVPYGGLDVSAPAGSFLLFNVGQSGAKASLAVKLTLYYDPV